MSKAMLRVTMIDGTETTVSIGIREYAEWERQPFGCSTTAANTTSPMLFVSWCAWRRLRYDGLKKTYDVWMGEVDSVEDHVDEDSEGKDQ